MDTTEQETTPNGFSTRMVEAINEVLRARGADKDITDIDPYLYDHFMGPMIDEIEEGL